MPGVPSWFPGSPRTIGTTSVKNYARSAHAEMADFVEELASLWPKGSLLETAVQSRPLRVARLERIDSPRHRRCYPPPLGSVYELVADVHWDVLRCSLIAVRVCQREAEVEVGGDCPTGLLHKPDVRDLQDIVIGRVPRRQVGGGTVAAIGPGGPVQVDALPVNPLALCMIWMPCIW